MKKLLFIFGIVSLAAVRVQAWVPETLTHDQMSDLIDHGMVHFDGGVCAFIGQFKNLKDRHKFSREQFGDVSLAMGKFFEHEQINTDDYKLNAELMDCRRCDGGLGAGFATYETFLIPTPSKQPSPDEREEWKFGLVCKKDTSSK